MEIQTVKESADEDMIKKETSNGAETPLEETKDENMDVGHTTWHSANKRKAESPDKVGSGKKPKLSSGSGPVKTAVMKLNEYKAGLEYHLLEQTGPVHQPTFVITVTVNGQLYKGEGGSKKAAKQTAAENALKSIVQFKNPVEAQAAMVQAGDNQDFTADSNLGEFDASTTPFAKAKAAINGVSHSSPSTPAQKTKPTGPSPAKLSEAQNPVMMLNEMKPGLKFDCSETGDSPSNKKFTMKVVIEKQVFEGSGASKKMAKQAAARSALNRLYKVNFTPMSTGGMGALNTGKVIGTDLLVSEFSMDQSVADSIGRLVLTRYDELMKNQSQHSRRKVIAGIVMSRGEAMTDLEVISVSTGTKCVSGEHMSVNGNSLNDCHAEIISRRCLINFLYSQLEDMVDKKVGEKSVLEESPNGGYRVKSGVKFHLYINTAPCGDARIFSPHEAKSGNDSPDNHSNRKSRGQLRTKIESGEGTIPVKNSEGVQTWDGVLQGARLLTMSCSDKVCRWNVLGMQGALLSYWLEPVYMHSVVLGSLFHPTHMFRALVGRIKSTITRSLPPLYRLHTPRLNLLSSPEVRQPGKAPNYSVNWTVGQPRVEVVDAMKGKEQDRNSASRLSKHAMFRRWVGLSKNSNLKWRIPIEKKMISTSDLQYNEVKEGSKHFQEAKKDLFKAFKVAGLGSWMKKPMEQDEFQL